MNIKVFGERNTGTNALISVIRGNSGSIVYPSVLAEVSPDARKNLAVMMKLGISKKASEQLIDATFKGRPILEQWKHAATYFDTGTIKDDVHFIFTTRHPLSWLIGLFKKPYHILVPKPENLLAFAEMNWETVLRDNLNRKSFKPLDLYVEKLKSYRDLMTKLEAQGLGYTIIKFEDFVSDQKGVFDRLSPNLTNPARKFQELTRSTKEIGKDSAYYRNYYTNELWREEFPEIENVKLPAESKLFEFFGYT